MNIDRKSIENAQPRVEIVITPHDIKAGNSKAPDTCAAARACLRQLNCSRARVHISTTYLEVGKVWYRYRTPAALRAEIISFDRGGGFSPGTFELIPIQPSHQARGRRIGGNTPAKPFSENRRKKHIVSGVRHNADVR